MDFREQTEQTRAVYSRRAKTFSRMDFIDQRLTGRSRKQLWAGIKDAVNILEIGVGAGANIDYYPSGVQIVAIDLSDKMIELAKKKADRLKISGVELRVMDVQYLDFPDNYFDATVTNDVFCSVPDPILGLREIKRVLKPGGRAVFLEHVRSANRVIGWLMDRLDPLIHKYGGMHINRRTIENLKESQLELVSVDDIAFRGIVKLITARN